mmetsp:Transcript_19428/g.38634  ORF Transcript_19428/g.38634 Transcript_19428/m.38634 type:complete len:217 (-) Transcript_19428:151-801(-)
MKIVLKRAVAVLLANIVYVDGACAYPPDDKGATINYKGVDVIITPDANLTIPSNWTEIPAYAFRSCGDVKKVVIPAAITKILDNAFHGSEIEELSFEKNSQLETISGYAFVSSNIQSVRIPKSVTEILGYAFYNSLLLEQVLFEPGSRLETIGGYVSYFPLRFLRSFSYSTRHFRYYKCIAYIHRHFGVLRFNRCGFQKVLQRSSVMHSHTVHSKK